MNLEFIEQKMAEKGLTRSDVAKMLEINLSTLWRLLNGRTKPKYMFVAALAQILDCSVTELQKCRAGLHTCPRCHYQLSVA